MPKRLKFRSPEIFDRYFLHDTIVDNFRQF